jgi:hypothetical protein
MGIVMRRHFSAFLLFALAWVGAPALAQDTPADPRPANLQLSAILGDASAPLQGGLHWRLFNARADADGAYALVGESTDPEPSLAAPPGDYVVHVAFGLASATKRITLGDQEQSERIALKAGALRITGVRGDSTIDANRLALAVYVPDRTNPEAKLVYSKARAGDLLGLPEGSYHIVSTYLDAAGSGKSGGGAPTNAVATNSIVAADIKVPSGKVLDLTLRHRYATLTLKLVSAPGADAMANSSFTVLTPGGDLIRELVGAFPSLALAEGEYIVIARHDAKTYQSTFQVQSGLDHDVEVIAQ